MGKCDCTVCRRQAHSLIAVKAPVHEPAFTLSHDYHLAGGSKVAINLHL